MEGDLSSTWWYKVLKLSSLGQHFPTQQAKGHSFLSAQKTIKNQELKERFGLRISAELRSEILAPTPLGYQENYFSLPHTLFYLYSFLSL